jgi:hypothetical protein
MLRLAHFVTHPIQYFAPLYRALAGTGGVELKVFFGSRHGVQPSYDAGFGRAVQFDTPLLEGYASEFLANRVNSSLTARRPGLFSPTVKDKETYTVVAPAGLKRISAVRLETLPHPSLPKEGSGRDANGNLMIIDTRTVQTNGNRNDCQTGTNGTVSDIVFGRTGTNNCQYSGRSDRRANDGVWRQVGQGRNNNSIYERRTVDRNGNVVVQRGRRNSNGSFTVLSTRTVSNNRNVNGNNGSWNRGHGDDDDDDNNSQWDNRRGNSDDHYDKSERKGNGKGKGKKGRD